MVRENMVKEVLADGACLDKRAKLNELVTDWRRQMMNLRLRRRALEIDQGEFRSTGMELRKLRKNVAQALTAVTAIDKVEVQAA